MTDLPLTAPIALDFGLNDESIRLDGDTLFISGRASTWDLDRDGEAFAPFAFQRSLTNYMRNPVVLWSHQWSVPLGVTTRAEVKRDGLHVTVALPRPERGTEEYRIWDLARRGMLRAFSVGGKGLARKVVNGVRTILDWDLREISLCPVGVNPNALAPMSAQAGKCFQDATVSPDARQRFERARVRADLDALRSDIRALKRQVVLDSLGVPEEWGL